LKRNWTDRNNKMQMNELLSNKSEWLKGNGPDSNIAISTRVRVARNLEGHLFFNRANAEQREKTLLKLQDALARNRFLKGAMSLRMKDVSELDRLFLVERHLMSREHMQDVPHKGLVVGDKEIVSVMLNEEDHIRLQVLQSGFNVMEAWRIVEDIDAELSKKVKFDYSSKFGYLTSCPTNTGTGMRASVMLHLSALVMSGQVDKVFDGISRLGFTMRGFYGEGTEFLGDFFQISNQVALGHSEMEVLDNLERVINKIVAREKEIRQDFLNERKSELMDRISRAYGTLKSARIITSSETIKLLSAVRLGVDLGFVEDMDIPGVNEILLLTQPAHLQKSYNMELGPHDRDVKRADLIREKLNT